MAAAPKCKLCGTAHWSGEPHAFSAPKPASPKVEKIAPAARLVRTNPHLPPDYAARLAVLEAKEAARKAKQAAYMRGYRARQQPT